MQAMPATFPVLPIVRKQTLGIQTPPGIEGVSKPTTEFINQQKL